MGIAHPPAEGSISICAASGTPHLFSIPYSLFTSPQSGDNKKAVRPCAGTDGFSSSKQRLEDLHKLLRVVDMR
ncbi:MAG: hypothetical protein IKC04_06565, partial [Oscillospiraceae bacterium]|nr:hypothetical protein [Oscillospiraceae bacterium]